MQSLVICFEGHSILISLRYYRLDGYFFYFLFSCFDTYYSYGKNLCIQGSRAKLFEKRKQPKVLIMSSLHELAAVIFISWTLIIFLFPFLLFFFFIMQIETLFISKVIVDLDYDTPRGE